MPPQPCPAAASELLLAAQEAHNAGECDEALSLYHGAEMEWERGVMAAAAQGTHMAVNNDGSGGVGLSPEQHM